VSQPPSNGEAADWAPALARRLAERASAAAGLVPSDYELLRFGTNAVFRLRDTPWVLRLRRPGAEPGEIERQVLLARWLADRGFAVNRPAADPSPVMTGLQGAIGSFWEWVENDPNERIGVGDFGQMLGALHAMTDSYEPRREFPRWNAVAEIEDRLAQVDERPSFLPPQESELLRQWTEDVQRELTAVEWSLPVGVIHGDAHTGNVLATRKGGVLIDLDALSLGPREWDLVPTAVSNLRFRGELAPVAVFGEGYGFDLLAWSGWPVLRRLRELYMTSWLATVATSDERRAEVHHRIDTLRNEREDVLWHAV
jgi:Ser/Thr protein kinase RdoA (MazF antagonist)